MITIFVITIDEDCSMVMTTAVFRTMMMVPNMVLWMLMAMMVATV